MGPVPAGQTASAMSSSELYEIHELAPGKLREGQDCPSRALGVPDLDLGRVAIGDFDAVIRLGVGAGVPILYFSRDFPFAGGQSDRWKSG